MAQRRKDNKGRVLKEGETQRPNGTYQFRWRDEIGKRHSIYAKTLQELREKEAEVLRDILDGIRTEKKSITINDLYYRWIELKRGLKDNTFQNYKYMYTQFVEPNFGNRKIGDLKRTDVRAFYNRLVDERHLKVSTIDCIHTVLHQVIELGVDDDYLRYNPADNALKELKKAHNTETTKRKALTLAEQERLLEFLRSPGEFQTWYPIFTVMLWTGMRVGETVGLQWCDVDFDNDIISINKTLVYYDKGKVENGRKLGFSMNTTKTKAGERLIPMLPIVKEALLMEKHNQEEMEIDCPVVIDGYSDFVFVNRFGGAYHQGTLNKALRRIVRDSNFDALDSGKKEKDSVLLPPISNHSLRHTFATRMCEAKVSLKAIQAVLGHTDIRISMDVYTAATSDFKRSELLAFDEYFNKEKVG